MIPEDFWTDEPATFPTRDAELAAAVDRLEARTVPHADRDSSEPRNVCGHVLPPLTMNGKPLGSPSICDRREGHDSAHTDGEAWWWNETAEPYWPTGAAQRARGRDDSATGHTETGEAQRGAQEPVEHNHPLDCHGCQKRGAEMVALLAEVERLRIENSHNEWACKGNQDLARKARAERDRLAGVVGRVRAMAVHLHTDTIYAGDLRAILDADAPDASEEGHRG